MADKKPINPEDLQALAALSKYPEWEVFKRLTDNRMVRDKNSIISLPSEDPRLPTQHAFYRGRISAILAMRREVESAARQLEIIEEKK